MVLVFFFNAIIFFFESHLSKLISKLTSGILNVIHLHHDEGENHIRVLGTRSRRTAVLDFFHYGYSVLLSFLRNNRSSGQVTGSVPTGFGLATVADSYNKFIYPIMASSETA